MGSQPSIVSLHHMICSYTLQILDEVLDRAVDVQKSRALHLLWCCLRSLKGTLDSSRHHGSHVHL